MELNEEKWWDDTDVLRLYHGTSSALWPIIKLEGLAPPKQELFEYALDILRGYIPEPEWTDRLVQDIREKAARDLLGRSGDSGHVIFAMMNPEGPSRYAESLCEHGGEIAQDVFRIANDFMLSQQYDLESMTMREYMKLPPALTPRFAGAKPILLEIVVPKDWCSRRDDPEEIKRNIASARTEGLKWAMGPLEQVYDNLFKNREVRVFHPVPVSMIKGVHRI